MVAGHYPKQRMGEIHTVMEIGRVRSRELHMRKGSFEKQNTVQGAAAPNWQFEDAADRVGLDLAQMLSARAIRKLGKILIRALPEHEANLEASQT